MSKRKLLLFTILLGMGLLVACVSAGLANGQNHYCFGESFIDIIQTDPLQVRFTCLEEFEVVFGGPDDNELIKSFRRRNEGFSGLGVILEDHQILQFYGAYTKRVTIYWQADN